MSTVFERLCGYSPNGELDPLDYLTVQRGIADLQARGWTDEEIVSYMRWMEEVNPDADEDTAIRKMKEVRERTETRLATK
jgi:hypothetical protein